MRLVHVEKKTVCVSKTTLAKEFCCEPMRILYEVLLKHHDMRLIVGLSKTTEYMNRRIWDILGTVEGANAKVTVCPFCGAPVDEVNEVIVG